MQLTAENLTVKRGGRTIISQLSLTLKSGEALLLTGVNGAGKTTLIRAIAGLLPISDGLLSWQDGRQNGDREFEIAEQCHYVGHLNAVKASLTVAENLRFWARFLAPGTAGGSPVAADHTTAVDEALSRFNLLSLRHIPAGYLSAGQKKRLGLARLLVARRPLWLLDEPSVSLDKDSQEILAVAVNQHIAAGGMAIAATHLPLGLEGARELRLGARLVAGGADDLAGSPQ